MLRRDSSSSSLNGFTEIAGTHRGHVGRHLLVHGALVEAGRRDAVEGAELAFDGCSVPDSHRLSKEEGDGEGHLRKTLAEIRIITGAMAVGQARAALDAAVRYAAERKQFGKPINRFQAIQFKLAEMATGLEAATQLVYYAAWLRDNGRPHHKEAAMCKLNATETAALKQVFGPHAHRMCVSATKSILGHLLGACASAEPTMSPRDSMATTASGRRPWCRAAARR